MAALTIIYDTPYKICSFPTVKFNNKFDERADSVLTCLTKLFTPN